MSQFTDFENIPDLEKGSLRILPLGGLGEIGMNCMVLEYEDEILIIDCGLMFSDLDHFGVEFIVPDLTYLLERKEKIKGILITHGHEDHIGSLPFALKSGIRAPIFCTGFASLLIQQKLGEYGLLDRADIQIYKPGVEFLFKNFKIKPVPVNHSIVDSCALIIKTPLGNIVHTGDFKIDSNPFYGKKLDETPFKQAASEGVLLLMSDSTNVERHECSMSESVIYQKFEQLFAAAEGLTIVAMFSSNVSRMGQIMTLAQKMDKKIVLAGRSVDQNTRLARELGYLKGSESLVISSLDAHSYPRNKIIVISSGSQAETGAALSRFSKGEFKDIKIQKGDSVIMSSRYIPGNEKAIGRMINDLFKTGANVLYEAVQDIHVSGHATRPELKQMLEWVKPNFFIPVHGEYRHLVHHANLAKESGVQPQNVVIATNGDVLSLTQKECKKVYKVDEPRVLVEGRDGGDISRLVLKDRRQLGEKGVVFSLLVRNKETGDIIAGPEIITKGIAGEQMELWLVEEARKIVKLAAKRWEEAKANQEWDLQETIRIELRRFFNANIGKKPTVLPIVLDL